MNIETIRHSLAHVMASAVQEMFPEAQLGVGPAIEGGFYHDFDLGGKSISLEDLPKIEKRMKELIGKNLSFEKTTLPIDRALKETIAKKLKYRAELIEELKKGGEKTVSFYRTGNFINLCKGPHVESTLQLHSGQAKEVIDAFKLTKIAGAYWRGSEKNPMLTRIYGVAFQTKKELENYLKLQAEAEKRDHRLLGQKLELFMFDEEVGAGLPLWMPKGVILRKIIEDYLHEELKKEGYLWLTTPHLGRLKLWQTSGHWELYRENLYSPIKIDEEEYMIKPMNCPFHVKIFQSKIRSYRDLPVKYAELGTVYRYEKSGVLHGLTRVRGFTQDDAHIFCEPEELSDELTKLLKHGLKILKTFGFKEYEIYLSTRPEKYAGTEKGWLKATNSLKYVLKKMKLKYQIDPGGGVFYGPKIDIKIKDSLGRPWQCTTIQVDFNLPDKFNVTYIDQKGKKKRPMMIHRALLGSLERFIGVLIEHYAGDLPAWLAPVQARIIPINAANNKYGEKITKQLLAKGVRAELKDENETVSRKIREGEIQKIPYLLVIGDRERKSGSVRPRINGKDLGEIKLTKLEKMLLKTAYPK